MLKDTLRQAFENALAYVESSEDMNEVIELKLVFNGLESTKEINVSLYWNEDAKAYRMSEKVETSEGILNDDYDELIDML